ncbi:hypothetical protein BHE74_00051047 [Ensete ventricosum]|nr:hypothetical protein BHE74_00051047 [Ensete ventricosum]
MVLLGYLPVSVVDALVVLLAKLNYGDLSEHGIVRPKLGPMRLKAVTGRSSVIDVGTIEKIKKGEIEDADSFLGEEGYPREKFPNHWKGRNDLYFVGFARSGLAGCSTDAQNAANDIARKRTDPYFSQRK